MTAHRIAILILMAACVAFSQEPRGTITGVLTDSSQSFITNVEIRATNIETGVTAASKTNSSGNYTLPFLLPGTYRVSAEAPGFKRFVREGIEVRVSGTVSLPIQLEVGAVSETVDVKEATPLLDMAGASLGQVVDHRRITELPIAAGNPLQLMLLAPGIVELPGRPRAWACRYAVQQVQCQPPRPAPPCRWAHL